MKDIIYIYIYITVGRQIEIFFVIFIAFPMNGRKGIFLKLTKTNIYIYVCVCVCV